ncbi:tetratricopeptide repeat protein [bacterium]|nr:tetratricopeptide repeat protein [bacterium]
MRALLWSAVFQTLLGALFGLVLDTAARATVARDFNGGVYLYNHGDYELAARAFETILEKYPRHARTDEVLFWHGQTLGQMGRHEQALSLFQRLIAEHPKSKLQSKSRFAAGRSLVRLDRHADALEYFSAVLADPASARDKELAADCRIFLAESHLALGHDQEAERFFRAVLSDRKLSVDKRHEAEFGLAKILLRRGRNQEAQPLFARVASRGGRHQAEAFMSLGDLAYADRKYLASLEWYEKVIRAASEAPIGFRTRAIYNGAWSYLALSEVDKSLALFSEVLEDAAAPSEVRADAALRAAHILREKGRLESADRSLTAALALAREHGHAKLSDEILATRAEWSFIDRRYDEASSWLSQVAAREYRFLRLAGQIAYETGRPADAVAYFDSAARVAPGRDDANLCFLDLAQSHFARGAFDSALAGLDFIRQPKADLKARMQPFQARVLHKVGRFLNAARLYEKLAAAYAAHDTGRISRSAAPSAGVSDAGQSQWYRYNAAVAYADAKYISQASRILDEFVHQSAKGDGRLPAPDSVTAAARLLQADLLASQKKYPDALAAYDRAVDAAAAFGPENIYLAHSHRLDFAALYALDRLDEFARAFVASDGSAGSYQFVCDRLLRAGLFESLKVIANEMLTRHPAGPRPFHYLMMANYRLGDLPAAVENQAALARVLKDQPSAALADESFFWAARLAQSGADRPSAVLAYEDYLRRFPFGKYVREARSNLGLLALDSGRPDLAEQKFLELLEGKSETEILSDRELSDVRYNLASVRIEQGRFDDASAILESLLSQKSYESDAACLYKLGYVHAAMKRDTAAEVLFRRAASEKAAPADVVDNALYALFSLLYRGERYADFESEFRRSAGRIAGRTTAARSRFLMGMTFFDADRTTEAAELFSAVRQTGDADLDLDAALRLADCHYNLRKYDLALEGYSRVAGEFLHTRRGLDALYAVGVCKARLGMLAEALEEFNRFLRARPDDPLAVDVALEAARLYISIGDPRRAEDKLTFLEKRGIQGAVLDETRRMRLQVYRKRGDDKNVIEAAKIHRADLGPDVEVSLWAAESALRTGRLGEAIALLDGFDTAVMDDGLRASIGFYRAEALRQRGDTSAADLYGKLLDAADSDIRLAARYRYGRFLAETGEDTGAWQMLSSVLSHPAARQTPFFQDAVRFALASAKSAGRPGDVSSLCATFASDLTAKPDRKLTAEYELWAALALQKTEEALAAAETLLSLGVDSARQDEIRMIQVRMAVSRGEAGRPILEDLVKKGRRESWTSAAAEALLAAAVKEDRHADVIQIVRLMQSKLGEIAPAALYARAMAHIAMGDTRAAIDQFRRAADETSPDTFHAAWSAFRVAQEELTDHRPAKARPFLRTAWQRRGNLDEVASRETGRQLVDILFELEDAAGLREVAADSRLPVVPGGLDLPAGLAAWIDKDYSAAAASLAKVDHPDRRIRQMTADSLKFSADTHAAIRAYEKIAEEEGTASAAAALEAAALYGSIGKTAEGLIAGYKILAEYESDTTTDLAADALLVICALYADSGDADKFRASAEELSRKYPKSRQAGEAAKLASRRSFGLIMDGKSR